MQTPRLLRIIREFWVGWTTIRYETMDPFDHPALRRMDLRELADLPVERSWERDDRAALSTVAARVRKPQRPMKASGGEARL